MNQRIIIFSLVLHICFYVGYLPGANGQCERAYRLAEKGYYSDRQRSGYSCIDKFYLSHGQQSYRKCFAMEDYYSYYGLRCDRGICPNPLPGITETVAFSQCSTPSSINCDRGNRYRTITGECNNLLNPEWGKSETLQPRLLPNAFNDGKQSQRMNGCSGRLPNPRTISVNVHRRDGIMKFEDSITVMVMQIGQLLAHDFILTKLTTKPNGAPLNCCTTDKDDPGCNPISVPPGDPFFKVDCLTFSRSRSMIDCNGIRQPVNSQSSYIDLSMVYGAFDEEAERLRSHQGGRLADINNKLPADSNDFTCELSRPVNIPHYYCLLAGDERVNEMPGLSSVHTLFMREHNRLADGLQARNPHWDDERVYQEARKINIAQWQNLVYGEYLPNFINPHIMRRVNIDVRRYGYKDTYDPRVDASATNDFGVGIFRFSHTLIRQDVRLTGFGTTTSSVTENLDDHFFDPVLYHEFDGQGFEFILKAMSLLEAARADREFERSIQDLLFKDMNNESLDLAALNIHRGREHGVPGYNEYRKLCELSNVEHFGTTAGGLVDHDPDVAALLERTYSCPEDIDIFTGMLTERRLPGVLIGPTAQCLYITQFKRFRDGDRFFYERPDPRTGFSLGQLNSIKRVTLATLYCLNTGVIEIQPQVFIQPLEELRNSPLPCSFHLQNAVNLDLWYDQY
ncbi:hypothetical protein ACF0H5_018771 [Mactra antiquata]